MDTILTKEIECLLSLIQGKALSIKEDIHTKNIIHLAYKHSLITLLYKSIQQQNPKHTLLNLLKPHYQHSVQKNMSMTIHLISVLQILKAVNIKALAFKGVVLSHLAYDDISLRQFGDLDILIHEKDKKKMLKCLLSHGYTPEIILTKSSQKYFLSSVNVLGFYSPDGSTLIEVHWALLSKNYAIKWKEKSVWENTQSTAIHQYKISTMNTEITLIYLCIHGVKHLFERLIWLNDIAYWIQSHHNIDWEKLMQIAKDLGVLRMLLFSFSLCHKYLELPLEECIKREIQKDTQIAKLQDKIDFSPKENSFRLKFLWQIRERPIDKFRFLYLAFFSTKFDDFKYIQLPSSLRFLYPFLRPIRLCVKYFK